MPFSKFIIKEIKQHYNYDIHGNANNDLEIDNGYFGYNFSSISKICETIEYSEKYRFGFNGMELDNEIQGSGNSYDFGARIYDSRLGRWLSLDPLQAKYPSLSPYCFVGNCPLMFIDPDGRKLVCANKKHQEKVLKIMRQAFGKEGENFSFNSNNELIYNGKEFQSFPTLPGVYGDVYKYMHNFTEAEWKVAEPLLLVMNSDDIIKIVFKHDDLTCDKGGEYTATKFQRHQNQEIVLDPDDDPIITDKHFYFKSDIPVVIPVKSKKGIVLKKILNESRTYIKSTENSLYSRFFHGLGHIIYQPNSVQPKVIEYDNDARNIKKEQNDDGDYVLSPEPPRQMDSSHEAKPD